MTVPLRTTVQILICTAPSQQDKHFQQSNGRNVDWKGSVAIVTQIADQWGWVGLALLTTIQERNTYTKSKRTWESSGAM